jgi:hypothetical protein
MNKSAQVSFTTKKQDEPSGMVIAGYIAVLFLAGVPVGAPITLADITAPCQFSITEPGNYHVTVARCSADGEYVSPAIESPVFTVAPDQIDVPLSVTVTLS